MSNFHVTGLKRIGLGLLLGVLFAGASLGQQLDKFERDRASVMLSSIKDEIKKNYYDPTFHGLDIDERFKAAEEKLKNVNSQSQALAVIAQAVVDLNDSHTFFVPPSRNAVVEYGWQVSMVGDMPVIIAVKPGSDAEKKGLKVGDVVIALNGFKPNRKDLWKINYYYYQISPKASVTMVVQGPNDQQPRQLEIASKVQRLDRVVDSSNSIVVNDFIRRLENESQSRFHRFERVGNIVVWQMPSFEFDPADVDQIMQDRVKGAATLILDLRGNPGGYVKTMERLAGYFFDKDTKIADVKSRKDSKVSTAVSRGASGFKGDVIVLVDSRSASAAEIFARLMQIEKRGVVIGDHSEGAVMQSVFHDLQTGTDSVAYYGVSITDADVIMTDGQSLENRGVTPDELVLPTSSDLALSRDVALARALEKAGAKINPEAAGKFFPVLWDK